MEINKKFSDIIQELKFQSIDNHILLGNGFSIAATPNDKYFTYEAINQVIINNTTDPYLKGLLKSKENLNLEYHLKIFNYALKAFEHLYDSDYFPIEASKKAEILSLAIKNIDKSYKELRYRIIHTLTLSHPKHDQIDYLTCIRNLESFKKIFTLNFDIFLYWLLMECNDSKKFFYDGMLKKNEGLNASSKYKFNEWEPDFPDTNIFYLHGALHLFKDSDNKTIKINNMKNRRLIETIESFNSLLLKLPKDHLLNAYNLTPLVVLDGNSESKYEIIKNNDYLKNCLHKLSLIQGNLMIYGCSILDHESKLNNDKHIWETIARNKKIKKIYISIYKTEKDITHSIKEYLDDFAKDSLEIIFFEVTDNHSIWQHNV